MSENPSKERPSNTSEKKEVPDPRREALRQAEALERKLKAEAATRAKAERLLKRLAEDKEKQKARSILFAAKSSTESIKRKLAKLLAATFVVGFTGVSAMRFLERDVAPQGDAGASDSDSESEKSVDATQEKERILALRDALGAALVAASINNEASPSGTETSANDVANLNADEQVRRDERAERVKAHTEEIIDDLLPLAKKFKTGKDLKTYLLDQRSQVEYFDDKKVDKAIQKLAAELENTDSATAKKLYDYLGSDESLDFALRKNDNQSVYENVVERIAVRVAANSRPFNLYFPDGIFAEDFPKDQFDKTVGVLQNLPTDQLAAVVDIFQKDIDLGEKHANDEDYGLTDDAQDELKKMKDTLARLKRNLP